MPNLDLKVNGNLPIGDFEITEAFNKYFKKLVPNLDLKVPNYLLCQAPKKAPKTYI